MSNWLLGGVGLIYAAVAADYVLHGKYGMAIAFVAYALANIGFIVSNMEAV